MSGNEGGSASGGPPEPSGGAGSDGRERSLSADGRSPTINVWRRWRGGADVPFHRYCDFYADAGDAEPPREDGVWLYFTGGFAREALRHTPVIVLAAVLVVGSAALASGLSLSPPYYVGTGLENRLPEVALVVVWLALLLWLLNEVGLLPRDDLLSAFVVYATLLVLLGDVVYWFTRVTIAVQEGAVDQLGDGSLLPGSGYMLVLFVGGLLVYDGMLRTENMFSKLHEKQPPIVGPPDHDAIGGDEAADAFERAREAYVEDFLVAFNDALDHRTELGGFDRLPIETTVSVRTATLFSVVFVLPFAVIRLPDVVTSAVLSLLGVVEVVVFFQFLVLIKYFHRLLTRHGPDVDDADGDFALLYQPDHPDGYAGFRDLGRFAIRVNTLLFLGGLYTAYWLYASGLPSLPAGERVVLTGEFLTWAFHYLGPLVVYVLTVVVWLYASFWQIHKAMRKGRERRIEMAITDDRDGELPESDRDLLSAPVWPLNTRVFVSILVGDTLPLLSLLPLL